MNNRILANEDSLEIYSFLIKFIASEIQSELIISFEIGFFFCFDDLSDYCRKNSSHLMNISLWSILIHSFINELVYESIGSKNSYSHLASQWVGIIWSIFVFQITIWITGTVIEWSTCHNIEKYFWMIY
jgi:hypothetical protein